MTSEKNRERNTFARECMILALKKLLQEKHISEITISELAKVAGISRTTFYRNYHSLTDIIVDYFDRYPFGAMSSDEFSQEGFNLQDRLSSSFIFLKKNQELLNNILEANQALLIYDNYNKLIKGLFQPRVVEMGFRTNYEQSAAAGLYFGICYDWIRGGMKESVEEMVKISYKILHTYYKNDGEFLSKHKG